MERTAHFNANHYFQTTLKELGGLLQAVPRLEGACLLAFLIFALA